MTQLRRLNVATSQQFSLLRKFLKQEKVPHDLSFRTKRYLEQRVREEGSRVSEREIGILVMLSQPLREELQEQQHKPVLCKHPFFTEYSMDAVDGMRRLCTSVVSNFFVSEGDMVFTAGTKCEQMLFVVEGTLGYRQGRKTQFLREEQWCSEPCLWTNWLHAGTLEAMRTSKLLVIDAAKFLAVATKHATSMQKMSLYAQEFVKELGERPPKHQSDLLLSKSEIESICDEVYQTSKKEKSNPKKFWMGLSRSVSNLSKK
eukprot:gnl/MRDRNA2_/MRDRNA2_164692_c0_seq1.p1 gnl/MRDRNA2_/MRDRNA2_164692_c0~~gnl/MRDRNA2_/MRDRNA2_164692_c0_seq1.p1  ORF type:complete len:266 (-),score=44.60 gnl/MRDRNA2_/MRDRNA2_164692_c0_seq1:172-948(-)